MSVLKRYLDKHQFRSQLISDSPLDNLGIIVVIPVHKELNLLKTLSSLANCKKPKKSVEVILVFNASESEQKDVLPINKQAKNRVDEWLKNQTEFPFRLFIIEENELPRKHAGVGLARKIGMDEAVRRFYSVAFYKGIIVCFDADCICLSNFLVEIESHFDNRPNSSACSIYFEHPTEGEEHDFKIYDGITFYELHLRYYKNALAFAQLPYAYHTVGSSMAVKAIDYCKQGGMNKRKAGEDFYFLQKFIDHGTLTELNSTAVIPSPRESNRVPFGTGRAIEEMLEGKREIEKSYDIRIFQLIRDCFSKVDEWYISKPIFHEKLVDFYGLGFLNSKIEEIRNQSTSIKAFRKRLFHWFNAFQALKFVHFLRDNNYPNKDLVDQANTLLKLNKLPSGINKAPELLKHYRQWDKGEL